MMLSNNLHLGARRKLHTHQRALYRIWIIGKMSICICCILDVTFQDVTFGKQLLEELIIHKTHREVQRWIEWWKWTVSKVNGPLNRPLSTRKFRGPIYFDDDSHLSFSCHFLRSELNHKHSFKIKKAKLRISNIILNKSRFPKIGIQFICFQNSSWIRVPFQFDRFHQNTIVTLTNILTSKYKKKLIRDHPE